MKLYTIAILLVFPLIFKGQTKGKINCEPLLSSRDLHNIIKQVITLRNIDTNYVLFRQINSLDPGTKDSDVLKRFIKPQNPGPYHAWAQLDSADVNYMLCIRKKHKKLEWDPVILGFTGSLSNTAISFSFPYISHDGKIIIVGYSFYGQYNSDNSYIFDGGYTLAIIKDGDKISVEELSRSLR